MRFDRCLLLTRRTPFSLSATFWFYFTLALTKLNVNDNEALDLLSTIRIMRLFKLFNHHPGLKVIITSMKYSSSVLWLLIFFVVIAVCIFASLIYFAERMTTRNPDENMFYSIPDALWFNMITMSTIGYGDLYPKTMLGMLIGAVSTGTIFSPSLSSFLCLQR